MVEVPEFSLEVTDRAELLESDMFPEKCLVTTFNLASAAWVICPAKNLCRVSSHCLYLFYGEEILEYSRRLFVE
jgi:hypothetical protein